MALLLIVTALLLATCQASFRKKTNVAVAVPAGRIQMKPPTHGCHSTTPNPGLMYAARPPDSRPSDLSNKDVYHVESMQDFERADYNYRPDDYTHTIDLTNTPHDFEDQLTPAQRTYCAGTSSSETNASAGHSDPVFGSQPELNPGRVVDSLTCGERGYSHKDRRIAAGLGERHNSDQGRYYDASIKRVVDKRQRTGGQGGAAAVRGRSGHRHHRQDNASILVTLFVVFGMLMLAILMIVKVINTCMPSYEHEIWILDDSY